MPKRYIYKTDFDFKTSEKSRNACSWLQNATRNFETNMFMAILVFGVRKL